MRDMNAPLAFLPLWVCDTIVLSVLAIIAVFAVLLIVDAVKLWIYGAPPERPIAVNPRSAFLWRIGQGAVFLFLVWAFYRVPDASTGVVPKHHGSAPVVVAGALVVFGTYMITRTADMARSLRTRLRWRR